MTTNMRPRLAAALAVASLLPGCASSGPPAADRSTGAVPGAERPTARIAPPAAVSCDPNHLTAWFGVVSGYRRDRQHTWLRIDTDYDTVEQLTLDHGGQPDASARFLVWGERFTAADWPRIETAPGVLAKGMRATAWMCDDGATAPVIDWQPVRP
jgi:hypothetical protein